MAGISYPEKGAMKKAVYIVKYHFHAVVYFYVWFGLVVCGLAAPPERVAKLGSGLITQGWQLSLLATLLVLPWPIIYAVRFRVARKNAGDRD